MNGPLLNLRNYKPACFKGRLEGSRHDCDDGNWKQIGDNTPSGGKLACQDLGFKRGRFMSDDFGAYNHANADFTRTDFILDRVMCDTWIDWNFKSVFDCSKSRYFCANILGCDPEKEVLNADCLKT